MSKHYPPPADPFGQSFMLLQPDGSPFNLTLNDLALFNSENIAMSLMYGAQIGLAALMLVTVCLLTQAGKRRSPIFAFNVLALILEVVKSSLLAVYMSSEWNNPYAYFADDQSRITRQDQANSIAAPIIKLLEIICVESSLVLQVRTILFTERKVLRHWAMVLSASISLMTIGVELALMVINVKSIAGLAEAPPIQNRLASVANLTITASICFFMLIFVLKLGFALKNRRKLGVRKFGPMQVVFIMGVQTMIVPAFSTIYMYFSPIDFSSTSITLVVISLPLSALWATVTLESATISNVGQPQRPGPLKQQRMLAGASTPSDSGHCHSGGRQDEDLFATQMSDNTLLSPSSPSSPRSDIEKGHCEISKG